MHPETQFDGAAPGEDPRWTRVAARRARLCEHVRIHRHRYRGKTWYVLHDRVGGRFHRFDARTYALLSALDGARSLREIHAGLDAAGESPPLAQAELVDLLNRVHAAGLLRWDMPPDLDEIAARQRQASRSRWAARLRTPFIVRFSLFDPDAMLARWAPYTHRIFGPSGLAVWLAAVIAGATTAILHAGELGAYWSVRAMAPDRMLLIALVFVAVKMVHELAHGLATRRWGGEVHDLGVMLLVLMPVPYVDASTASAFPEKRRRIVVAAAGIMAELFLASMAALAWAAMETGTLRDLAFATMLVGGISTLLFNGNPLLRFDGYYVLSDFIEIPNLASRASAYYGYLARRYAFGDKNAISPRSARGERAWFLVYGLAAFCYRIAVTLGIALFVAGKFLVVGVIAALWGITGQFLLPLARSLRALLIDPGPDVRLARVRVVLAAAVGLAAVFLFILPLPLRTHAEGVVWLPENARLHAGASGFIREVVEANGNRIEAGQPLLVLDDPLLDLRVQTLEWDVIELSARRAAAVNEDRTEISMLSDALARVRADLEQAAAEREALTLRSPVAGSLVLLDETDLPGRFVRKGDALGLVFNPAGATIRSVLPQSSIALVRRNTEGVRIRLAATQASIQPATLLRETPAATYTLPSIALGTRGGGRIAVDPADPDGRRALEQLFEIDLALPGATQARPGMRAYVRFEHGSEPPARRLYRALRRLFLGRFSI